MVPDSVRQCQKIDYVATIAGFGVEITGILVGIRGGTNGS